MGENNTEVAFEEDITAGLKKIIDEYIANMRKLIYDSGYTMKDSVVHYFGRGKAQKTDLHQNFYEAIEKEVADINAGLESSPDADKALSCINVILNYNREDFKGLEDNMRLAFISIEALSIPLLSYISEEEAASLASEYRSRYSKSQMLPKQQELYNKMRECAGEQVKKKISPSDIFKSSKPPTKKTSPLEKLVKNKKQ